MVSDDFINMTVEEVVEKMTDYVLINIIKKKVPGLTEHQIRDIINSPEMLKVREDTIRKDTGKMVGEYASKSGPLLEACGYHLKDCEFFQSIAAGRKYPFLSQRVISENDLDGVSPRELEIMRNEIYAWHGWVFNREDLRDYFEGQPWYQPKGDLSNREQANRLAVAELTDIEKQNIQTIVSREKALKK